MPFAPELRTHSQKVCTLYKKAMRQLEAYHVARLVVRYHQVILRNEFDKNKCVCDPKEQRRLLWVGEYELFTKMHPLPLAKWLKLVHSGFITTVYDVVMDEPMIFGFGDFTPEAALNVGFKSPPSTWIREEEGFYSKQFKIATSIGIAGGVAHERVTVIPDWVLDYWHPLEKAQYPEYFRKREIRKCEFIKHWNNKELC